MTSTQKKTPINAAAKRGRDITRTARAVAHLDRLNEAGGKRVVADLDAPAMQALSDLLSAGYANSRVAVIRKALIEAAKKL